MISGNGVMVIVVVVVLPLGYHLPLLPSKPFLFVPVLLDT